ncbi:dihydrofolate reductase family protein [Erysipelothrix urinaevulpis]|uniref:dihydrofolate reductase family protein n=1 Tax=Erysipelothrix urinaevulpis TaxID=2683717 RepID=UPI00135A128A|nr:dihydrofolate reductase family protein [Erysipelothrix urinaevulpis]
MTRKVKLFISMSLDGYIADLKGGIDWLEVENYETDDSYTKFYDTVDTVLMGYTTYDQITNQLSPNNYPYKDSQSIVFTHKKLTQEKNIKFTSQSVNETVNVLKKKSGKDIWIVGGSKIIKPLVEENMIDEYYIAVIPKLIGRGIPLFAKHDRKLNLILQNTFMKNGIVYLCYKK